MRKWLMILAVISIGIIGYNCYRTPWGWHCDDGTDCTETPWGYHCR